MRCVVRLRLTSCLGSLCWVQGQPRERGPHSGGPTGALQTPQVPPAVCNLLSTLVGTWDPVSVPCDLRLRWLSLAPNLTPDGILATRGLTCHTPDEPVFCLFYGSHRVGQKVPFFSFPCKVKDTLFVVTTNFIDLGILRGLGISRYWRPFGGGQGCC